MLRCSKSVVSTTQILLRRACRGQNKAFTSKLSTSIRVAESRHQPCIEDINIMSSDSKTVVSALRDKFLDQPPETHTKHWDDLWQKQTTPWDRNGPSIALKDTITGKKDVFGSSVKDANSQQRKRALVPGCKRHSKKNSVCKH